MPAALDTRAFQRVAPVAVRTSLVRSRTPSPLGEMSVVVEEAEATLGGTVSMVTAYLATCDAVTGRADGALYVRPPPLPTSWRM